MNRINESFHAQHLDERARINVADGVAQGRIAKTMISCKAIPEGDVARTRATRYQLRQIRLFELAGEIGDGTFGDRDVDMFFGRSDRRSQTVQIERRRLFPR